MATVGHQQNEPASPEEVNVVRSIVVTTVGAAVGVIGVLMARGRRGANSTTALWEQAVRRAGTDPVEPPVPR